MRLSVVVPAYREGAQAATAVRRLRQALAGPLEPGLLEIIVVDDGSPDDTADQARSAGADRVLRLAVNRGKGAAVRTGVLAARGRTVAFTDADLSYSPDQVLTLLAEVERGCDMAVGSRRHPAATAVVGAGLVRRLSGRVFNLVSSLVVSGHYGDTQCGLKAFRADVAATVFAHQRVDGMAFDVEVFHLAERFGLSLVEVPVELSSSPRSTVRVLPEALRMLRDLVKVRWWSGRGVYDRAPPRAPAVPDRPAAGA